MSWKLATYSGAYDKMTAEIRRLRLPLDCYRPTIIKPRSDGSRVLYVTEPLYYNYLFVRLMRHCDVEEIQEVIPLRFVVLGDYQAEVSDFEVELIRSQARRLSEDYRLQFDGAEFGRRHKGDDVVITAGALAGMYAEIIGPASAGHVYVELKSWQKLRCKLKGEHLELIRSRN